MKKKKGVVQKKKVAKKILGYCAKKISKGGKFKIRPWRQAP